MYIYMYAALCSKQLFCLLVLTFCMWFTRIYLIRLTCVLHVHLIYGCTLLMEVINNAGDEKHFNKMGLWVVLLIHGEILVK